jgi:hypothetical protein
MLAVLLVSQTALPVVLAAARLVERLELQALGLLDAPDCHAGVSGKPHSSRQLPGHLPSHDGKCDCCLTGCGAAGPTSLPTDRGALVRPLLVANTFTGIALDASRLRSYLTERTRSPRSPPALA